MTTKKQIAQIEFLPAKLNERLEQSQQQVLAFSRDFVTIYRKEKERRRSLEETNQKLRATLDSISDAMVSTDDTLSIEDYNVAFRRLVVGERKKITGLHLADTIDLSPYLDDLGKFASNGGKIFDFELTIDNNGHQHFLARVSKILTQNDDSRGFVFVFRDMTEAKRLERLKDRLFVFASNEIRTPLNGLTGFLNYLYEDFGDKLADEELAHFRFLIESGENLENIVEDLMKLSPLNQGNEPQNKPVRLSKVVETTLASVEADAQSQEVSIELDAKTKGTLVVDEILLLKAFESIVSAMIYSSRHGDDISIIIAEDNQLTMDLSSSAPLNRFGDLTEMLISQNDSQDEIGSQRIGIGLAKDIIEWNGGKIRVKDAGCFTLEVSFAEWLQGEKPNSSKHESGRR